MNFKHYIFAALILSKTAFCMFEHVRVFEPPDINHLPGGIVFPRFTQAAWVNPAAFSATMTKTIVQTTLGTRTAPEEPYLGSLAAAFSNFDIGLGAGYSARFFDDTTQHSLFAGGGIGIGRFGFGIGAYRPDITLGLTRLSLGMNFYPTKTLIDFAAVLYDAQSSTPTLVLGAGLGRRSKYSLEVNAHIPMNLDSSVLARGLASLTLSFSRFTLSGTEVYTHYRSNAFEWRHTFAMGIWLSKKTHFSVQYNAPLQFYFSVAYGNSPKRGSHSEKRLRHRLSWD